MQQQPNKDDNKRKEQEEKEKKYNQQQKKGIKDENLNRGMVSEQAHKQRKWNDYFSLSKFMVGKDSSTLHPAHFALNINDMKLFDNGNLHSLDVFQIKASAVLSNLKMNKVKKIRNGSLKKMNGLSYKIYISPDGPSLTGFTKSLNSLNNALGKKGIHFLTTNTLPFVIVWSGYVTSITSTDNMSNIYNFIGSNNNPMSGQLMMNIDDGSGLVLNSMNNSILKKPLFKNKKYPIHIIYFGTSYSSSNTISLTIMNTENNPIAFSYLKENDQVYDPHKYYFGMVQVNNLYKFYTIYDSTINIVSKSIKYMMSNTMNTVQPNYVNAGTINGINLTATIPDNTSLTPNTIVRLTELDTNFRTNKQFYVNEYDKKMKLVPENASFLAQHPTKSYIYAGNFAPPKNLTLNAENAKDTDQNGCKQFCKEKNCTSFYSYVQSVPYQTTETKEETYQVDVSNVIQIPTLVSSSKPYNTSDFNFDKNKYNYVPLVKSRQIYEMQNQPKTVWSKETRTRQVPVTVTKLKDVNKCILNNDINETNMVPLNKMNTIQPETQIKSSKLYIQNKQFAMDSTNMPEYVKSRNGFTFYNINDPSNFTQGFDYDGTMNTPMPIGRQSLEPVKQTIQSQKDLVGRLIANKMDPSKITEKFSTREGMTGDYDGIIATSNSILNQLYTIHNINLDISHNTVDIERIYADLSGNCKGTPEKIQSCIKYKFSTHDKANITKKITDKNDAYQEDLTEVQLQQNNTYVLGAITTASLLIFAIMMARE